MACCPPHMSREAAMEWRKNRGSTFRYYDPASAVLRHANHTFIGTASASGSRTQEATQEVHTNAGENNISQGTLGTEISKLVIRLIIRTYTDFSVAIVAGL